MLSVKYSFKLMNLKRLKFLNVKKISKFERGNQCGGNKCRRKNKKSVNRESCRCARKLDYDYLLKCQDDTSEMYSYAD